MMQHVVFKRIALVAILAFLFISNPASATEPGSGEGSQNLVIEEYNGRIVYVDFWASWCVPCRKSFPWLSEMQKKYKSKGLEVVTVNLDKEKAFATKFLDEFPENNLKVVYDPDGVYAEKYKITGMPSSVIFDRTGKIFDRHVGFKTDEQGFYEEKIKKLL